MNTGKTLVMYRSKTGFTKNYADWIAQELSCDLRDGRKVKASDLAAYDTVIFGGSMYMGGILGVKFILKHMTQLQDKNLIVFGVGSSPAGQKTEDEVIGRNFTASQLEKIQFFYFPGGFDFARLSSFNKFIMKNVIKMLAKKADKTPEEQIMLDNYENSYDQTSVENLAPLFAKLKE